MEIRYWLKIDAGYGSERENLMIKGSVLYLMRYADAFNDAKKIKFDGQIVGLKGLGYNVHYLALENWSFYLVSNNNKKFVKKICVRSRKLYFHTKFYFDLFEIAKDLIKSNKYSFIYVRSMPFGLKGLQLFKTIKRQHTPLVIEVPTYIANGGERHRNQIRAIASLYFDSLSKLLTKYVTLYVLIGDEGKTYLNRPAINIFNGIDVDSTRIRKANYDPDSIHLVSISSMAYWHGYDRLIKGLANYVEQDCNIQYHVIGDGVMAKTWKELALNLNLADSVLFHGAIFGDELYDFLDHCDIGIGALGLHLKQLNNTSELKIREYTAVGIPFIYAADDSSIFSDFAYGLRVLNDDSAIDIKKVIDFAKAMREKKHVSETMRNYAFKNMSWESQWKKIIARLKSIGLLEDFKDNNEQITNY